MKLINCPRSRLSLVSSKEETKNYKWVAKNLRYVANGKSRKVAINSAYYSVQIRLEPLQFRSMNFCWTPVNMREIISFIIFMGLRTLNRFSCLCSLPFFVSPLCCWFQSLNFRSVDAECRLLKFFRLCFVDFPSVERTQIESAICGANRLFCLLAHGSPRLCSVDSFIKKHIFAVTIANNVFWLTLAINCVLQMLAPFGREFVARQSHLRHHSVRSKWADATCN